MCSFLVLLDCISPNGCSNVSNSHALPESCHSVSSLLVLTGPLRLSGQPGCGWSGRACIPRPGQDRRPCVLKYLLLESSHLARGPLYLAQQQASSRCQKWTWANVSRGMEKRMRGTPWLLLCFHWERVTACYVFTVCTVWDTAPPQKEKKPVRNENSDRI